MIRSPACVDALEARICSNVTHWREWRGFGWRECVSANGFSFDGRGSSPEAAVRDFLFRNNLSGWEAEQ